MTRTHLRRGQFVLLPHASDADEAVTVWLLREALWRTQTGIVRGEG